ncbi:hypothetical protein RLOC_00011471 [Lonchura striata]|uniref:DUF4537 domain-containing protein n=1 Tax=Lonchura striata TaxID=40157 RepID=A0A218V0S8_9PASE|nr:hypothetical protein RLOC_00011471 [Lonchura striata domestica]
MPLIPSSKRNFIGSSLEASHVLRGARVLARRETDGYYYLGHIVQEVKGKVQRGRQETPLYDILHYEDARQQPLAPGDRVLAPWEASAKRFGPGTVLRIVENTEASLECSWGCTSLPQCCLGAWESTRSAECQVQQENAFIPGASLTEGKLNKKIEQQLSELRIASSERVSREEEKKEEKRLETDNVPEDVRSCLEEDCKVIETEKGPQTEMVHAVVDAAVNTDSWLMETDHKEEAESRQQDAETEADFEHEHGLFESRVAEAPVQHSQRSPSLGSSALAPFQCQSFFAQVNQSLEKDSLTIRSAFRVQRPHSSRLLAGRATHLPNLLKDKSITAAIASENIARAGETAGVQRESFAAHDTAPGCWG